MLPSGVELDLLQDPMTEVSVAPMEALFGDVLASIDGSLEGKGLTPAKSSKESSGPIQDALDGEDLTPAKANGDISLPDASPLACSTDPEGTVVDVQSGKATPIQRAGEWLDARKRQQLLSAVAARFKAPLEDTLQDSQQCRSFWQQDRALGVGLTMKEIPRRLRTMTGTAMTGTTIQAFERRYCRWLQGTVAFDDDTRMSAIMLDVLNELIVAAHGMTDSANAAETRRDVMAYKEREEKRKRNVKRSDGIQGQAGIVNRQRIRGTISRATIRRPEGLAKSSSTTAQSTAEKVAMLVQEIAASLTKWHLRLRRQNKDSLATGAVKMASHYARVLASFRPSDVVHELQANAEMLGMIAFTIHKLVQLAASMEPKPQMSPTASFLYFLRLSGGGIVQVDQLCHSVVLASVELLAMVWPAGFLDFKRIEDMPKPPRPTAAGGLRRAICKDTYLCTHAEELNRRLLQAIDRGTDSLILCCACTSIDTVLQVVRDGPTVQHETGEDDSRQSALAPPPSVVTVDLEMEDAETPALISNEEVATAVQMSAPRLAEDFSQLRAKRWEGAAEERGSSRKRNERPDTAEERAPRKAHRSRSEDRDDENSPLSKVLQRDDDENSPLSKVLEREKNENLPVSKVFGRNDDENMPLSQSLRPSQEDESDDEDISLVSLI